MSGVGGILGIQGRSGLSLRGALAALTALVGAPSWAGALCLSSGRTASVEEIVDRVTGEYRKYIFIGERHWVGPVKRFAVDLANALVDRGYDVGLYVEGFREGCMPQDDPCWSIARAFNERAFLRLLEESKAPVHAIDPSQPEHRAGPMAERIAGGTESIRIVLVGTSHVVHAEDPTAEVWIFGGAMKYANPGDVAEAFPRDQYLTLDLALIEDVAGSYALLQDGCAADYVLATRSTRQY
ncbi:MAG TPA: hypothetical protein VGB99_13255 [Acidobacteriota bacterium]